MMKKWIVTNKLLVIGTFTGAATGFVYWKFYGCLTGTCSITSNPIKSTIYFAIMGAILFSLFKNNAKKDHNNA